MTIRTLHDLFIAALEDVLYAETLVARKLPAMAAAAGNRQLRALLESARQESRTHVARLKRIFHAVDEPAVPRRTHRAWGITEEAASASELADQQLRDAWAGEMDHEEAVALMGETLREERTAERALERIAATWIGGAAIAA